MEELPPRRLRRLLHALAMAGFGMAAHLVLLAHPFVVWSYGEHAPTLLLVSMVVVGLLGNLLWRHDWLLDRPILTGVLLTLNASIGVNIGMVAALGHANASGVEDVFGAVVAGMGLGIAGVVVTFPFGFGLGWAMALLSERLQRRLGVRDEPAEHDTWGGVF